MKIRTWATIGLLSTVIGLPPLRGQVPQQPARPQATIEWRYGTLKVSVVQGGTVYLDGSKVGELPPYAVLTLPEVVAGPHTIRVEKAGYRTKEKAVVVPPEQTTSLELRLTAAGEPVAPPAPQPVPPAVQPAPPTPQATAPAPLPQGTRIGKDGLGYVWIPPRTFMMGCSPGDSECRDFEKPAHRVTISKGFWMGKRK